MTAKEFDSKYPYGLKKVIYKFQRAAYEVFNSDEFDLVLKGMSKKERKEAEWLKEMFKGYDATGYHWMLILPNAPQLLLADIITVMALQDDEKVRGEDIED